MSRAEFRIMASRVCLTRAAEKLTGGDYQGAMDALRLARDEAGRAIRCVGVRWTRARGPRPPRKRAAHPWNA